MTNGRGLFSKFKESSLSISLTAALILVASIVVIISSITIQSAYMWLAVGATAVLFLGFCSCTTCERTPQLHFRRGSIHSDSISTISDGRDNFYEVNHPQISPYWIADLPPSYAAATSTPESQLPPSYSSLAEVHGHTRNSEVDTGKPCEQSNRDYIGGQSSEVTVGIEESNITRNIERNSPATIESVHIVTNNRTVQNNGYFNATRHQNNCRCDNCVSNIGSLC